MTADSDSRPRFWLATFDLRPDDPAQREAGAAMRDALATDFIAIEIITAHAGESGESEENQTDIAVLVSAATRAGPPCDLRCRAAYANSVEWADRLREQGFNALDAKIDRHRDGRHLEVFIPFFPTKPAGTLTASSRRFLRVTFDLPLEGEPFGDPPFSVTYKQSKASPSVALPRDQLAYVEATGTFVHVEVKAATVAESRLQLTTARFPRPFEVPDKPLLPAKVWHGRVVDWLTTPQAEPPPPATRTTSTPTTGPARPAPRRWPPVLRSRPRDPELGPPSFRFEGVESVGFRVNLADYSKTAPASLRQLLEPLNFHLSERYAEGEEGLGATPFEYRAASTSIAFELLRYDKILLEGGSSVFGKGDYLSQHEFVVRILTGRVDDDSAQARDPAVFVPAIFVDNPWSRLVGRELQGFEKVMADFHVEDAEKEDGVKQHGICDISELRLVKNLSRSATADDRLLALDYATRDPACRARFVPVDLERQLGSSLFSGSRWLQDDFDQREFRRSFARSVMEDGLNRFRSIQVTPIDRRGLPRAWIRGMFELDNLRVSYPVGVASLTLSAPIGAPAAWKTLSAIFGGEPIAVTTGDWYRLKCSMRLTVNDGLD